MHINPFHPPSRSTPVPRPNADLRRPLDGLAMNQQDHVEVRTAHRGRRLMGSSLAAAVLATAALAGTGTASAHVVETAMAPPTVHDRAAVGLPTAKVEKILAENEELKALDAKFDRLVGPADGGSYVNDTGELIVLTTNRSAAAEVRAHGGQARVVENSEKHLTAIVEKLNAFSADHPTGSIQTWGVDTITNEVTVTRTAGAHDAATNAFLARARALGDVTVTAAPASEAPQTTDGLYGGLEYGHTFRSDGTWTVCSLGFNAVDSANRYVNVTAGHCLSSRPSLYRYVGSTAYLIGSTRSFNYPGRDYGVFNNSYPSYWTPVAAVANYAGGSIAVRGSWGNPPVGATVCKSGRTTGFTCGTITALNQTVVYSGGYTIYGLTRHNACVEGGDSGGANISSGGYALGMTSGASTSSGKCLSKVGGQNVSWYQPIVPALNANGLRLLVTP
jgi:Alpha-lytic protease prodomain/Trypsin